MVPSLDRLSGFGPLSGELVVDGVVACMSLVVVYME